MYNIFKHLVRSGLSCLLHWVFAQPSTVHDLDMSSSMWSPICEPCLKPGVGLVYSFVNLLDAYTLIKIDVFFIYFYFYD